MQNIEEKIKSFIELAELGLYEKNEVIEMQEQVQDLLDEVNSDIVEIEECLQQIEIQGDAAVGDAKRLREIAETYGLQPERIEQLDEFRIKRQRISTYLDTINRIRSSYKNFDKALCFHNIRKLLKTSDVKIGQIEHEAGVRLGYMSRLGKPENTSEPSMEFVVTAAKCLGVSVDFLISARMDEMTPTEEYVLKFIGNIIKDTKEGKMCWKREGAKVLNSTYNEYERQGRMHCLFAYNEDVTDGNGNLYMANYQSRFFPERRVEVTANSYNTELPRTNSRLYIVPCIIYKDDDCLENDACCEVYIVDNYEVTPICNTLLTCNAVAEALRDLYKQIQVASSHIQINDKAKSVIDAYMNPNCGFMQIPDGIDEELPFN